MPFALLLVLLLVLLLSITAQEGSAARAQRMT
jgi:hypothetical protein